MNLMQTHTRGREVNSYDILKYIIFNRHERYVEVILLKYRGNICITKQNTWVSQGLDKLTCE